MPRPKRIRRIREYPDYIEFRPLVTNNDELVLLTLGEYECICLIDYENMTHQECAEVMNISRTTVTETYESARKKVADFIVNGKTMIIAGGNYHLIDCKSENLINDEILLFNEADIHKHIVPKPEGCRRVAVPITKDELLYIKFSSIDRIKIYDIKDNQVIKSQIFYAKGMTRGQFVGVLIEAVVDVFIGYKLGRGAMYNLNAADIEMNLGIEEGNADKILNDYLEGKIVPVPRTK